MNYKQLTAPQRYQIECLLREGFSQAHIARAIGVHKSTSSREIKRNSLQGSHPPDRYKAASAQLFASHRAYKPPALKSHCPQILRRIDWLLARGYSPEQIAGVCRKKGLPMLSTEAIYRWIYKHRHRPDGADRTSLLRRRHRKRRKRALHKQRRTLLKDKVSIHQRPPNTTAQSGHYEADTAHCKNGCLLVLTETCSLHNLLVKLPDRKAQTIEAALERICSQYPIRSITTDNGAEFAHHQAITQKQGFPWYFADPHSPQQRGKNENQIGLIRQYITRKTDLNTVSDEQIKHIENTLNNRPRKNLNFQSPKQFLKNHPVALGS